MPDRRVVIIDVEGGNVQRVEQPPDVDVHIIDFDTEGLNDAELAALCTCEMGSEPHFHAEYPGERAEK